jgi:hypothetical protein
MNNAISSSILSSDTGFLLYVGLLAISGALLIVMGVSGFGRQSVGLRVLDVLFGLGFLGYAFYLFFIFDGGTYTVFFYAFIVPILLVVRAIRGARA